VQKGLNWFSVGTGMVPLQYRSKTDCVHFLEREKALPRKKKVIKKVVVIHRGEVQ